MLFEIIQFTDKVYWVLVAMETRSKKVDSGKQGKEVKKKAPRVIPNPGDDTKVIKSKVKQQPEKKKSKPTNSKKAAGADPKAAVADLYPDVIVKNSEDAEARAKRLEDELLAAKIHSEEVEGELQRIKKEKANDGISLEDRAKIEASIKMRI